MVRKAPDINHEKIKSDIDLLRRLIDFSIKNNWRAVVYGGYSLDGYLRTITRSHGDLDIVIFGQSNRQSAENLLKSYLESQIQDAQIIIKQEPFFLEFSIRGNKFSLNLYFVETLEDPHKNLYKVRKLNGEIVTNNEVDFPPPIAGKLLDLDIEVQDQRAHLADILRKRGRDVAHSKHDQDIANIRAFVP